MSKSLLILPLLLICLFAKRAFATLELTMINKGETVNVESKERTAFSAGETIKVDSGVVWIEQENHVPIIVYEANSNSKLNVQAPKIEEALYKQKQVQIDAEISEVLLKYSAIQRNIKTRRIDDAVKDITQLRTKFPNVAFLDFLEASVAVVKGDSEKAKSLLKRGLVSHPDFEEGKKLLQQLERRE